MRSSYQENNYGFLITSLVQLYRPKKIIEFGVLEGYSLRHILDGARGAQVVAYDIFSDFPYHHAQKDKLQHFNGIIRYGNFYEQHKEIEDNSIDFLHVDIANDGYTYEFFFENYLKKLTLGGHVLLKGGSQERDEYDWMVKYKKPHIQPVLRRSHHPYWVFQPFPSMTLVERDS